VASFTPTAASATSTAGGPGALLVVSPLDRGRDTIQLRETPGNLSGSGSETHQHFSPADANCCQSLLLDPAATIGIDLRKRLFLLVKGRGE
jgi:hypothetical protein